MLGEHGRQRAQTLGSLHVAHDTHNHHGRGLQNGHGLHDLLLVSLAAGTVQRAHDVRHTGLVAHEGGQVRLLGGVVLREASHVTTRVRASLAGQETHVSVTGA